MPAHYRETIDDVLDHYGVAATSGFVEGGVPGGRVHYLDAGAANGDPVVFLHGGASQATEWVPLLAALDDAGVLSEYRALAFERPGFGLSAPVDYRGTDVRAVTERLLSGVLDAVDADSAHLVGNSFGGYHALAYALRCPDAVDSVVAIGAPAGITREFPWLLRLLGIRGLNRLVYGQTVPDDVTEARDIYRRINVVDDGALPDVYLESVAAAAGTPGRKETVLSLFETLVGAFGVSDALYLGDELSGLETPTTFVWGTEDWYYPPSVGRPVADAMSDATFVELPDANHKPWFEPDSTVAETVAAVLSDSGSSVPRSPSSV